MSNVFGIITTIVLIISGFVAYKNKAAHEAEIVSKNTRLKELKISKLRFETARESLATTMTEHSEVQEDLVKQTEVETKQKKTIADLQAQLESDNAEVTTNKAKLDEFSAKTEKMGDIKELANKMKITNAELEELSQTITASEAKLAILSQENTRFEEQVNGMKSKFERISSGQSLPTLNTQIRSIYPTWGFVTLATGNSGGVVTNSTLDVVRNGSTIAKLLVTAVERNSASASIIPDSLSPDVTLMVGDRVIPSLMSQDEQTN